jgi:DNA ligase (NAD+)
MKRLFSSRLLLSIWLLAGGVEGATSEEVAQAEKRMTTLRAEIAHHDELYFREAEPEISDEDYDQLRRELRDWERRFPELVTPGAVGDDRDGLRPTVAHGVPMLGLDKVNTPAGLEEFVSRVERRLGRPVTWVVEPKFDGIAVSVTYENGRLVRASTRGNGAEGEDVTAHVRAIQGLPTQLKGDSSTFPPMIELRGEIYLPHAEFSLLNADREEAGLELYSHPRTVAAGTMKQSDPLLVARRHLAVAFLARARGIHRRGE